MFVKHIAGVFRLIVTQIINQYFSRYIHGHKCYLNYSFVRYDIITHSQSRDLCQGSHC